MGQCISRELNLERQTEKEKDEFYKEYLKRFHVSPLHLQRQRAFAHPKLQLAQEQVIRLPAQPAFVQVVVPQMEEFKVEEPVQQVIVEARSPTPPQPVIEVESQPPPQLIQVNQPSYHLIRSIGPISNIATQRKSIREASASRRKEGKGDQDLNMSYTFKRDSAVEARKSKISATPAQAIIQNLLNEYLPIDTGKRQNSQRLSSSLNSSGFQDYQSTNPRSRFNYKDHDAIKSSQDQGDVEDLVKRYASAEEQRDNVRDNENGELRKLLKEEEEIKETVRQLSQDNLSNKETSFPSPRQQDDRPKVKYYKKESEEEFLEEDSDYMQNRGEGETLDAYLARSTVFKRDSS